MLRAPRIISSATRAVFRSLNSPLLKARSPAKVHERCTRGCTARRRWRTAWNRSRTTSAMVRDRLRDRPSGRSMKRANTTRVRREPRDTSILLIVMAALGASPVNRLEMETPSSASRPCPVLARASMIEASCGRFATRTRPSSRSYQRNAGTPSALPIRMACCEAGVVHGSCTIHSWRP